MMQILRISLALLATTVSHLTGPALVFFDCSDDAYDYR